MTPKNCIFRGFGAAVNHRSVAASLPLVFLLTPVHTNAGILRTDVCCGGVLETAGLNTPLRVLLDNSVLHAVVRLCCRELRDGWSLLSRRHHIRHLFQRLPARAAVSARNQDVRLAALPARLLLRLHGPVQREPGRLRLRTRVLRAARLPLPQPGPPRARGRRSRAVPSGTSGLRRRLRRRAEAGAPAPWRRRDVLPGGIFVAGSRVSGSLARIIRRP